MNCREGGRVKFKGGGGYNYLKFNLVGSLFYSIIQV